jgi:hypothetical protein
MSEFAADKPGVLSFWVGAGRGARLREKGEEAHLHFLFLPFGSHFPAVFSAVVF